MTVLRRGWPALAVGIILGALVGAVVQMEQTPQYQSSATVYVAQTGVTDSSAAAGGRTSGVLNLDTESNLVTSGPVLDRARKLLHTSDSDSTLAGRVSVTVPANTQLMKIVYESTSRTGAQAGAAAIASAYLADRLATAQAYLAADIKLIQNNLNGADASLKKAAADAAKYTSTSTQGRLAAASVSLLNQQISGLTNDLGAAKNTVVRAGTVTVPPILPTAPAGVSKKLFIASGAAVGILLGVVGAWLLARRPIRRLKRPVDLDRLLGVPVIARINGLQLERLSPASTPTAEAFRRLVNVVNASLTGDSRVIVVAGIDDSAAASTVTHNMAATLSRSGERVTLLTTANEAGSSSIEGQDSSYSIVPSTGPRTRKVIDEFREQEEGFILIDAPQAARTADAQSYGAVADAIVIVVRTGSKTKAVQSIIEEFDAVGAPVLGAVLVDVSAKRASSVGPIKIGPGSAPRGALGSGEEAAAAHPQPRRSTPHQMAERTTGPQSATARRIMKRTERLRARAGRD